MAQTKHEIQAILAEAGSSGPRHRFGQNFMIDQNLVRLVADAGKIAPGDLVIEVGPGTGTLTEELLARGADVVAVEIDRDLAAALRAKFASSPSPRGTPGEEGWGKGGVTFTREALPHPDPLPRSTGEGIRLRLIEGDALAGKHALNAELLSAIRAALGRPRRLVANLPYNIASPLVIELMIEGLDLLAFTVQKEVADRLRGPAGSDAYGPLSVMAQMLADVEVLRTLPPQAFWPSPNVESALVRLRRHDRLGPRAAEFGRFVAALFSARRKTLRKAMTQAGYVDADGVLAKIELDPQVRIETLSPQTIHALFLESAR
jgi:16S rRNA (adenine1518-N6/adenine1519-N6)-dimethyltransferase